VRDVAPEIDTSDAVGSARDRKIHDHFVERLAHTPFTAEYRKAAADKQRQLRTRVLELEPNRIGCCDNGARDFTENHAILRRGLLAHQRIEAVLHVGRGYGLSVMKTRGRIDVEGHRKAVR